MTISARDHLRFQNLIKEFAEALISEAQHRREREEFLPSGEIAWVVHEREFMRNLVNVARAERGLDAVAIDHIADAERSASGHADYPTKFGLYCARIVFEEGV